MIKTLNMSVQPSIGMVSLGCPKALVDSEYILTKLRAEGYKISTNYKGAHAVIVNTCGFLNTARTESLKAIGEAIDENGKVIVTGCLGNEPELINDSYPKVLAVTGANQFEKVIAAVHKAVPPKPNHLIDLLPPQNVKLTPRHYSYLKISEGCNHKCKFCIIPNMRGRLKSRPAYNIMREAEKLVGSGVKELLIISQDTSAYGLDINYREENGYKSQITNLAKDLGSLGVWIRLHYVYPYPYIRNLIPLMADRHILPYLDIPFQHAHPSVLQRMSRPAASAKTLEEIKAWRTICPDITLRSTFIVGYPGETEEEFQYLLNWLDEAQLDRIGCFKYENVKGALSQKLPGHLPEEIKLDRQNRLMAKAQEISFKKLQRKVGKKLEIIIDKIENDGATCRTWGDAPEIDGNLYIDKGFENLTVGTITSVIVDEANEYDLWGYINNRDT